MPHDFALARLAPVPICWNLYDTAEQAQADLERANASAARHCEPRYALMTYAEFAAAKRRHYLAPEANPLTEITAERYHDALNVLPPMCWEQRDGVERFMLCELLDGTITDQYAQQNGRFWTRRVDSRDRETWITAAEIVRHLAQEQANV